MSGEDVPENLETAEAFEHLGWECLFHDRLPEAVEYHRRALAVRERVFGPDHWEVANSLVILAGVMGHDEFADPEVEDLTRRSLDIYDPIVQRLAGERGEVFGHAFHGLLGALNNLALLADRRGDLDAAEARYRDIQERMTGCYGPDCGYVHPSLPGFAVLLIRRGKATEAESHLRAAVRFPEPGQADDWTLAKCEQVLADLYLAQGRTTEAEALYRAAIGRLERGADEAPLAAARMLARALTGLAGLCRRSGREQEAQHLERRAKTLADPSAGTAASDEADQHVTAGLSRSHVRGRWVMNKGYSARVAKHRFGHGGATEMQPEESPPGCFPQAVGQPLKPEHFERIRSQGRESLCEFFFVGGLNTQSRYKLLRAFFPMSFREFRALEQRVMATVGESCTVLMPLVGENTEVWRPVTAVRVEPGVFRLCGPVPEGESWAFSPGELVRCAVRAFAGGEQGLTAYERAVV